jgi:septal ring-binding cell division protein DamX
MRGKKGLVGKIFAIIGIFIFILLVIVGISAYQGYKVFQTVQTEQKAIEENALALVNSVQQKTLTAEDCKRPDAIEKSVRNIKDSASGACKNPIIKIAVKKVMASQPLQTSSGNLSLSCDNLEQVYSQAALQISSMITPIKAYCQNPTLS